MPHKSRWGLKAPDISIPSFMFPSPTAALDSTTRVFVDAKRPTTHYFTAHTYRAWSKRLAAGLLAAGLQPGERVMLFSGNSIFTPVVLMGVIMAGGIFNSANPAFTPRELAHQLRDCEPRFVLAAGNCLERARKGAEMMMAGFEVGDVFLFEELELELDLGLGLRGGGEEEGEEEEEKEEGGRRSVRQKAKETVVPKEEEGRHWRELVADPEAGRRFRWEDLRTREAVDRTALLIYSSGTTGLPKGVEVSHRNIVSNACQMMQMSPSSSSSSSTAAAAAVSASGRRSTWSRRTLACLPMYHGLGLIHFGLYSPKAGIQVFLMERFDLLDLLGHIQRHQITELALVPPILIAMAKYPAIRDFDLSSVRKVTAGAAPIGLELTQQFEELWGGKLKVRQGWGMSEAPCSSLTWHEDQHGDPTSVSVGEPIPGLEAMIVDSGGNEEARPRTRGELWVRGPNIMKGYWRNPASTAETKTPEGWLKTGDIAYVDEQGKFYIVDRKKELIKVRGAQVAPAELEALLLEHPHVVDAGVIGIKTASDDELPRAYVVPRSAGVVTPDEIKEYVNTRVSKAKRLTGGVVFAAAIPKNPSGKILRKALRELAAREAATGEERPRAHL